MSYTETETITHALRKSGLLGEDETPTSEAFDFAQKVFRSRVAALSVIGIRLWDMTSDSIPDELFDPLAEYVSIFPLSASGGPHPTEDQVSVAESMLRKLGQTGPTGDVIAATYY